MSAALTGTLGVSLVAGAANAEAHYNDCSLVRGRLLRVREETRYNTALAHAVSEWDSLGGPHVFIGEGTPHVYVSDYRADDGLYGYFTCADKRIRLNAKALESRSAQGDKSSVTHELGHPLHLGHSYTDQLMSPYANNLTTPQSHDRKDFRDLWVTNGGCTYTGETVRSETGVDTRSSGPVTDLLDTCAGGPSSSPFGDGEPARGEPTLGEPRDQAVPGDEAVENPVGYEAWLVQQIIICSRVQTDTCFLTRDFN